MKLFFNGLLIQLMYKRESRRELLTSQLRLDSKARVTQFLLETYSIIRTAISSSRIIILIQNILLLLRSFIASLSFKAHASIRRSLDATRARTPYIKTFAEDQEAV